MYEFMPVYVAQNYARFRNTNRIFANINEYAHMNEWMMQHHWIGTVQRLWQGNNTESHSVAFIYWFACLFINSLTVKRLYIMYFDCIHPHYPLSQPLHYLPSSSQKVLLRFHVSLLFHVWPTKFITVACMSGLLFTRK